MMKIRNALIALIAITTTSGVMAAGMNQGKGMNNNMKQPAFSQFDLDKNGIITQEEYNQARNERMNQRKEEGRRTTKANDNGMFTALDKNADGVITSAEFAEHQNRMMVEKRNQKVQNTPAKNYQSGMKAKGMKNAQRPAFSDFDADGDNSISPAEFDAFGEARQEKRADDNRTMKNKDNANPFTYFDQNGDGIITEDEFKTRQGSGKTGKGTGQGRNNN
ncbi:EF-hand domain-containing protein [Vibrio diabolicus]|uniref:peptidylprolyl isomerase n=1 Tax=Vibrio diabolicus TaxID=50719 RepID=A0AA92LV08_9VIBR|nr:EF-hand domain-containing protein [Vibrio diabolicus]QRG81511.1 EF-hand domain-containing protein [Vibrio diabolicus]